MVSHDRLITIMILINKNVDKLRKKRKTFFFFTTNIGFLEISLVFNKNSNNTLQHIIN